MIKIYIKTIVRLNFKYSKLDVLNFLFKLERK